MYLPSSEPLRLGARRWAGCLAGAGLVLGCCSAAQAFAPMSGPVLSGTAVAPNVVMLFDNSSSMVLNRVPGTNRTRLDVARDAALNAMASNRNLRFGLFVFRDTQGAGRRRDAPGGRLAVELGSITAGDEAGEAHFRRLQSALDAVAPSVSDNFTYTPLAESYYEMTRYMRGLRAFYPQSTAETSRQRFESPIQYRCQRNFGLILTDGLPTYDSQFPSALADDADGNNADVSGSFNLPDWDGNPEGDVNDRDVSDEGSTFYLDDIAAFAYDTDLRSVGRHGATTDEAGVSFDDPKFPVQNMRTVTVGFAVDDPRLRGVAHAGHGSYYTASSASELNEALAGALQEVNAAAGSGGGGVSSAAELSDGSVFYRTRYDSDGWSGAVEAYRLDADGQVGQILWSTDQTVSPRNRAGLYQTWRHAGPSASAGPETLGSSSYAALSQNQRSVLDAEAAAAGLDGMAAGQRLLDWARGDDVAELRDREVLLGDIIAAPLLLAGANDTLASLDSTGYEAYRAIKRREMIASLITGANDGLVHVLGAADGRHRYAFLPAAMHRHLGDRARTDFGAVHESGMDGPMSLADVPDGDAWATLVVGGMGAGGKGLFGLRLFDQLRGNQAMGALWEVNAADAGWKELGFTYGSPVVAQVGDRAVVIAGNGYGGASGQAVLYVLDALTGAQLTRIEVGEAGANGLSTPQLVTDAAGNLTGAYAGDLNGQLWSFDLSGEIDDWQVGFAGQPLFSAGEERPITVQPQIVAHPRGGHLILFGTGKFMEGADLSDRTVQGFYAVWDRPDGSGALGPDDLLAQSITGQEQLGEHRFRSVSQARVDWTSHSGWMLPLVYGDSATGERVTRDFITRGSRVIFSTGLIKGADRDPCTSSGDGWLMVLDIYSGGMLPTATLDTNGDRQVDDNDDPSAGMGLDIGLPGQINLVRRPSDPPDCNEGEQCECEDEDCPPLPPCGDEYYLLPGSDGMTSVVGTSRCQFRRIMWRQLL